MINYIYIENFRSIKELEIETENLNVFLGPNSTGKTNILKAIDLVLGEAWTTKGKALRELFNDPSKPIKIIIGFAKPVVVPGGGYSGVNLEVNFIELTMTMPPEQSSVTTINGGQKFYAHEKFKKICHFIYIPSERNLSSELRVSEWTMLGKLMKLIYENYKIHYGNNEAQLKKDFAERISSAKEFLEEDFDPKVVTFSKFKDIFESFCKQNSIGLANSFMPILDIYNLNWFYKTLQIHVKEDGNDLCFDSEEVGAGMQNMIMLSIFQTYSELMGGKVIFGIEEPEIYLYPHAQRSLYENFISLSEKSQIFYTTHNPNFVSAERPNDIKILRKSNEKGTYLLEKDAYFTEENAKKVWHKIYTHFNVERNEIFFANKVLLVEGASDKILFETLCSEKWGIDLNKLGYSIIECGGKGGVQYFIGVAKLIGLESYYAVWDKDGKDALESFTILDNCINEGKGLELDPDLEVTLGIGKGEKVRNAYDWVMGLGFGNIPEPIKSVHTFLTGESATPETPQTTEVAINISDIPF